MYDIQKLVHNNRAMCTAGALVGVPLTAYLAARAGAKTKNCETKKDVVKLYLPSTLSCAATMALIFESNKLASKEIAKLAISAASYATIKSQFDRYIESNVALNGTAANNEVVSNILAKKIGTSTLTYKWYEPETRQFFDATEADILDARYQLNKKFKEADYATLADWCVLLKLDVIPGAAMTGWSTYSEAVYGYRWIDVDWKDVLDINENITYRELHYPVKPHADFRAPELL